MRQLTRRQFLLKLGAVGAAGLGTIAGLSGRRWWEWTPRNVDAVVAPEPPPRWSTEARYYTSLAGEGSLNCSACHSTVDQTGEVAYCHIPHTGTYVKCNLCPHGCVIADGERGLCRTRENRGGVLYTMSYGNPCAVHIDPIEKKPFFHFLPTAAAFSLATAGCNLRCLYCQNWQISQVPPEQTRNVDLPPGAVAQAAVEYQAPVVAYTYSEPTAFYDYMLDSALEVRDVGLRNVVISSGYINPEPLRELCQAVDAIKIDLKGFNETFYDEVCGARLEPVLRAIQVIHNMGVHLEIVNLVVPTLNDNMDELHSLIAWVRRTLGPDVPLHFSRFHPNYQLTNLPPTPVETLTAVWETARELGLHYPSVGNVPDHPGNHTYCPGCGEIVIRRRGFAVEAYHIEDGACVFCGQKIAGVWWRGDLPDRPVVVPPGPSDS